MNRKEALKVLSVCATGLGVGVPLTSFSSQKHKSKPTSLKGNINHSACQWCYDSIPLEQFCEQSKDLGLSGIDLLKPDQWSVAEKYGLTTSMAYPEKSSLTDGFCNLEEHEWLQKSYLDAIPAASDAGLKNIICFSGNRKGQTDEAGLENCAKGLDKLVKKAEKYNITLTMELLNSKVDHKDYLCDKSEWGVALCEKLGSPNFNLLYDIYHMQIMEGDVIATIRKNNKYYGHYHTGGVPGRHEINDSQELNYPAIMKAILETGFSGFVAQEFIPTREDKMASLKEGVLICDV